MVRYGRTVEDGALPVYSTDTEEEAKALIVAACPRDRITGEYYAPELVERQNLRNLAAFSQRLHDVKMRMEAIDAGRKKNER